MYPAPFSQINRFDPFNSPYNAPLGKVRVGQTIAAALRGVGGKSGLHRAGRQVTPGGRESMESATENIPPKRFGAGKGEKVR